MKNRVHLDVYVRDIAPLLALGARCSPSIPDWMTLADIEGNEFCAFLDPGMHETAARTRFAVCTDSDRPEELAAWWASMVGADVRDGPGRHTALAPRCGRLGGAHLEVRPVDDERVVPNRWQWTVPADPSGRSSTRRETSSARPSDPAG